MNKSTILDELNISFADKAKDEEYINKLNKTKDKVKYLRLVKNYTQMETASLIGISERHVQRIEKTFKNK